MSRPHRQRDHSASPRGRLRGRWLVLCCTLLILWAWAVEHWSGESSPLGILIAYAPQVIWMLPAGLVLLIGLANRSGRVKLLGLGLVALVAFPLMGLQVNHPGRPRGGARITIATWNVHNEYTRADAMRAEVDRINPDILVLQEASSDAWQSAFADRQRTGNAEQWIYTRGQLEPYRRIDTEGSWRNATATEVTMKGLKIGVLDAHLTVAAPAESFLRAGRGWREYLRSSARVRHMQIASIADWAKRQSRPFIVAGDFNTPPDAVAWAPLRHLTADTFAHAGRGFGYTFRTGHPLWRIDQIRYSRQWRVLRCGTFGNGLSDHAGVWAELELTEGTSQ